MENTPDWIKLWYYFDLDDEEFERLFNKVYEQLKNEKIEHKYELLQIVQIFLSFSEENLISQKKEEIIEIAKKNVEKLKKTGKLKAITPRLSARSRCWAIRSTPSAPTSCNCQTPMSSRRAWPISALSATSAIITTASDVGYAAIASTYAHRYKVPLVLLTKDASTKTLAAALAKRGVKAVLIGPAAAVSSAVETALKAKKLKVVRLAAADRAGTAALVAARLKPAPGSTGVDASLGWRYCRFVEYVLLC